MWTLVGRVAMNIFQREDSQFFFMRVFVKYTNPLLTIFKPVTPAIFENTRVVKWKLGEFFWCASKAAIPDPEPEIKTAKRSGFSKVPFLGKI